MSTLVLAFDTATEVCSLALGARGDDGRVEVVTTADFEAPRAAMSRLLPAVQSMLARTAVPLRDVGEVVVGRGPGSFTGVRIGVATAKGIAHGLACPLYGVGTLDAVAWGLAGYDGLLGVVGDAMRGEIYPALFRVVDGRPVRLAADRVASPEAVAAEWRALGEALTLAGNGLAKHGEVLRASIGHPAAMAPVDSWAVSGRGLLLAYEDALRRGDEGTGDVGGLLPVYTRLSDAEQAEMAREGRDAPVTPATGVQGPAGSAHSGRPDASS